MRILSRRFHLTILGSNSAVPAYGRFPTSQFLQVNNHNFLIDCGEGTQIRIAQYKVKRNSISYIFISHLHGDHLYGLPGLITSMALNGRTKPLHVYGPKGIKKFIDTVFELSRVVLGFELEINEIETDDLETILEFDDLKVSCFPVLHRLPTYGYRFDELLPEKNLLKSALGEYKLSIDEMQRAKRGEDIPRGDNLIPNDLLTHPRPAPCSYTFCADSIADTSLLPYIEALTAMYFETTYLADMQDQANARGHATSVSAALLAAKAKVRLLITGHYSSRYRDLFRFKEEVDAHFSPAIISRDGEMINLLDYTPEKE